MTQTQPGVGRATIYDVARAAGVSHQTVSRFLKGYQGIRPETRERVTEALIRLDYRPNLSARSLTTGRSHRLGALTHEISQVGPSKILEGANTAAREAGYLLDVITLDVRDPAAIKESIELVMQNDLAGVLTLSSTDEMTAAFSSAVFRVPAYAAVDIDDEFPDRDRFQGVGMAVLVQHLAALGHRDVLHVAGPPLWVAARNRVREFEHAMADAGLQSRGIIHGDWSAASGYRAIMDIPEGDLTFTAVIAANDQTALGVMLALGDRGLRVPDDVSVAGIDDIPEAEYYSPPLTTMRLDFANQGREAVQQLIARIDGVEAPPSPRQPSKLIVRRSTGPVRPH